MNNVLQENHIRKSDSSEYSLPFEWYIFFVNIYFFDIYYKCNFKFASYLLQNLGLKRPRVSPRKFWRESVEKHKSRSERLSKASPNEIFLEQFVAQTSRGQAKGVDVYETRRSKIAVTAERKTR